MSKIIDNITKGNNSFKFRSGVNIGSLDAESDKFLAEAFVERRELFILSDTEDYRSILLGRTGTGKTAILKHIEDTDVSYKVVRIEPEAMSLTYLSNSTVIDYFNKVGVNLELFYKTLWKHVFIVELLKLHCGSDKSKFDNIIDSIIARFDGREKSNKIAAAYLSNWKDSFWQNTEQKVKEIERAFEKKLVDKFDLKSPDPIKDLIGITFSDEYTKGEKYKYEVFHKSQTVASELQIQELKEVINIMKNDFFDSKKGKYVIVIDDLDKEWVDKKIVYDLIKSMIEAIRELKDISGTKIIIAIRENLYKLIMNSNQNRGAQREKLNSFIIDIKWTKEELVQLVNNRLAQLMKGTYTNKTPKIDDILKGNSSKSDGGLFDYILDRTFLRPRDVIDYFNKCIKYANGKSEITSEIVKMAELDYSRSRVSAIEDEWRENFPFVSDLIGLLKGEKESFTFTSIQTKIEEYVVNSRLNIDKMERGNSENLNEIIKLYRQNADSGSLSCFMMISLYEMGILGIKLSSMTKLEYSYESDFLLQEKDIDLSTKFVVHKAFHRALTIIPNSHNDI